jgi:hypothetical protein
MPLANIGNDGAQGLVGPWFGGGLVFWGRVDDMAVTKMDKFHFRPFVPDCTFAYW